MTDMERYISCTMYKLIHFTCDLGKAEICIGTRRKDLQIRLYQSYTV